jgi:hypothetical protein
MPGAMRKGKIAINKSTSLTLTKVNFIFIANSQFAPSCSQCFRPFTTAHQNPRQPHQTRQPRQRLTW